MKDENVVAYIATKMADLVSMKMNKRLNSLEKALSEKDKASRRENYALRIQA